MDPVTRRSFLIKGSVGTAVAASAVGAVGAGRAVLTSDRAEAPMGADELTELDQPLVLNISDASTGEVELLVGEREVVLTDKALVAKLLRAAS